MAIRQVLAVALYKYSLDKKCVIGPKPPQDSAENQSACKIRVDRTYTQDGRSLDRSGALTASQYFFPGRFSRSPHITQFQYALNLKAWVAKVGLDPAEYATHSLRRTKVTVLYKRTKNLRVIQLLPGHTKLENTVRYLGIEVDDALEM